MREVVQDGLRMLSDADLQAIAAYLLARQPTASVAGSAARPSR
jgi:hypothetical protein